MYIVGFNGPPESGKDSLAEGLMARIENLHDIPIRLESLSMPLREIAYAMVGFSGTLDGENYEQFKRTTWSAFQDMDGRQLMIYVSERFLKPCFGSTIMARLFIERNRDFGGIILLRDSGFQVEVNPLIDFVGPENFYIARCYRPGKTFANDSREYVYHPVSAHSSDFNNDSSVWEWKTTEAARLYGRLVNQMGWTL